MLANTLNSWATFNLNLLLTLVDDMSIGTATRGALKEDTTFRGLIMLQDVIKKCNKVLESMLIRRKRKYTPMFRIVSASGAVRNDREGGC